MDKLPREQADDGLYCWLFVYGVVPSKGQIGWRAAPSVKYIRNVSLGIVKTLYGVPNMLLSLFGNLADIFSGGREGRS